MFGDCAFSNFDQEKGKIENSKKMGGPRFNIDYIQSIYFYYYYVLLVSWLHVQYTCIPTTI